MINLIVEVEKSGETCDKDGCHPVSSIETSNNTYPQTMHDLVQASKCDSTILGSSKTYEGVEALQLLSMVMLGFHDSGKPSELSQI